MHHSPLPLHSYFTPPSWHWSGCAHVCTSSLLNLIFPFWRSRVLPVRIPLHLLFHLSFTFPICQSLPTDYALKSRVAPSSLLNLILTLGRLSEYDDIPKHYRPLPLMIYFHSLKILPAAHP